MNIRIEKQFLITGLIILFVFGGAVFAGSINKNAGTSSFPFLKINIGARAVAMGGAFTGLADDESSLYYNPAGITKFEENRFIAGYHNYFVDMQSGFVGVIRKYNEKLTFGGYFSYLNYGDFTETNQAGEILGDFGGGDVLLALSTAYQYRYNVSFGGTVKFIYESVDSYSATGMAVDLGVRFSRYRNRLAFGLAIQNIGTQFSSLGDEKYRLPLTFRGGASLRPRGLPVIFAGDIIAPIDNDIVVAIGGEYVELKPFYIRMGWNSFGSNYRTAGSEDSWAGLGIGFGLDIKQLQISYAFTPGAELGDSHRITVTGRL